MTTRELAGDQGLQAQLEDFELQSNWLSSLLGGLTLGTGNLYASSPGKQKYLLVPDFVTWSNASAQCDEETELLNNNGTAILMRMASPQWKPSIQDVTISQWL